MAGGFTTTDSLSKSMPSVIASARNIREYEGVMSQVCEKVELGEGEGDTWTEVSYNQLQALAITQTTVEENYQQMTDALLQAKPTMVSVSVLITDEVARRITKKGYQKLGALPQNAVQRKKDKDGITLLDGASTQLGSAGATVVSGLIAAAESRIRGSNDVEPAVGEVYSVLHPRHIKALGDELKAGVGTYPLGEGPTARVFSEGFNLPIANVKVFRDGNIPIDSSGDAKGGVFAKMAILLVQGRSPWTETVRKAEIGGGSNVMFVRDQYIYVERSPGNWLYEIIGDATAPTS